MTPDERVQYDVTMLAELAYQKAHTKVMKQMVAVLYARAGVPKETFSSEFSQLVKEAAIDEVERLVQRAYPALDRSMLDDFLKAIKHEE